MAAPYEQALVTLAGAYYAAAELCRRGCVARVQAQTAEWVDLHVLDPLGQRQTEVRVYAVRAAPTWGFPLPEDAEQRLGYFAFVVIADPPAATYTAHVLTGLQVGRLSDEVVDKRTAAAANPTGRPARPLLLGPDELDVFRDNWDRILAPWRPPA